MNVIVWPGHRCELIYLMSIVLMKDIGTNMGVLGPPPMPSEGAKIAKSRFWSVPPLNQGVPTVMFLAKVLIDLL